jgi:hypothetical protein
MVLGVLCVASSTTAIAAFSGADLRCRETVSKRGFRLASDSVRALAACDRGRIEGEVPVGTDCRSTAAADSNGKIAKAAAKLASTVPAKCGSSSPALLSYVSCPVPCDSEVQEIGDFQDVAACVECLVRTSVETMSDSVLGSPALPLGDAEAECQGALREAELRYFLTILKETRRCQKKAEKSGAMDTSICEDADPRSKIVKSSDQLRSLVRTSCDDAFLFDLDSCAQVIPAQLEACSFDAIDYTGRRVFRSLYDLDAGVGVTTTTVGGTVSTTTNTVTTTTTTTLPDMSFDFDCTIRFRVTSSGIIGSLQWEASYAGANGGFVGSGLSVQCTNLIAGVSKSFFDDETARVLRESVISTTGFSSPVDLATCTYETDDAGLAASDFSISVNEATTPPPIQPLTATVAITSVQCSPKP